MVFDEIARKIAAIKVHQVNRNKSFAEPLGVEVEYEKKFFTGKLNPLESCTMALNSWLSFPPWSLRLNLASIIATSFSLTNSLAPGVRMIIAITPG